jgi:hypothetical protein
MSIKQSSYLFLLLSAFLFLQVRFVYAADELHLTGMVKSIDHNTRTVFVNVLSSSCPGMLRFAVDDAAALDDFVGQKISFFIDSSTCRSDQVYKMLPGWRAKR